MGQTALVPSPKGEEEVKCAVEKKPVIREKMKGKREPPHS